MRIEDFKRGVLPNPPNPPWVMARKCCVMSWNQREGECTRWYCTYGTQGRIYNGSSTNPPFSRHLLEVPQNLIIQVKSMKCSSSKISKLATSVAMENVIFMNFYWWVWSIKVGVVCGTCKLPTVWGKKGLSIGYITRGRSLRDLHTRGPQARGNVNLTRRDRLPSDVTNLYHGKSIERLTRFEDRNNVWPKLMVSYKFMLK